MLIIDDELLVTGAKFSSIRIRVSSPEVRANGHLACDYELVAGDWSERFAIYGAGTLQTVLLTLSQLADRIGEVLAQHSAKIEDVVWDDLKRLQTPPEALAAAIAAYRAESGPAE